MSRPNGSSKYASLVALVVSCSTWHLVECGTGFQPVFCGIARAQERTLDTTSPLRGWSFRSTGEGTFYWFQHPQDKSAAQEATTPLWFSLNDGMFYLSSNRDIGASLFDLAYRGVNVPGILAGEPFLLAEFERALNRRTGEANSGGRWAPARNGSLAPADFLEPYPGWRQELFGDFNKDGAVTVADLENLAQAMAAGEVRLFVDDLASDNPNRSARMDLDVIANVALYCPPECYPELSAPDSGQTAAFGCDGCGGGGGGPPPPPPPECWGRPDGAPCVGGGNPCTYYYCLSGACVSEPLCDNSLTCCDTSVGIRCCPLCCDGADVSRCCGAEDTCCGDDCCPRDHTCCSEDPLRCCPINGKCCPDDPPHCCAAGEECCYGLDLCCGEDGDACTKAQCTDGVCEQVPVVCDDESECTTDSCDSQTGCVFEEGACEPNETCFHGHCCAEPDENDIDCDGIPNSEDDDLDGDGIPNDEDGDDDDDDIPDTEDPCPGDPDPCCGSTDPCCGSSNPCCPDICTSTPCLERECDPTTGQCVDTPVDCDDNDPCTNDSCDPASGCKHASICDDEDPCTFDCCEPETLECTYSPTCDDGNACTQDICNSGNCTFVPQAEDTVCFDDCKTGICASGVCVSDPACPTTTGCCDDKLCCAGGAIVAAAATCAACCAAGPCEGVNCDDGEVCTWDLCNASNGNCINKPRVDLEIKTLAESIEDQLPGRIMCVGSDVKVEVWVNLELATKSLQGCTYGSLVLQVDPPGVIAVFQDHNLINPLTLGVPLTPPNNYPPRVWLKALTPGTATLSATWTTQCFSCSDEIKLTIRPLWTSDAFPQMTFNVSGAAPLVNAIAPAFGPGINPQTNDPVVGFGFNDQSPPIQWYPQIQLPSNGTHVRCNEFTVGIIQNMLSYNGSFTYTIGMRAYTGACPSGCPSLDQYAGQPGPGAFYRASATATFADCGTTAPLQFQDAPSVGAPPTNTCSGGSGQWQSASFHDSLETWLVAKHNPTGCYTVLKHFTWGQNATHVDGTASTTVSGVDNGPGGTAKLDGLPFNQTIGQGNCQ